MRKLRDIKKVRAPGAAVAQVQFARVHSLKLGNAELHDQLFATLPLCPV